MSFIGSEQCISVRCMTASSSGASSRRRNQRAGSSFPIRPRKSRKKVKSSPSGRARATRQGKVHALDVKKGDRILFGKWSGTEVKIDGVEYLVMKESDIMGVIETKGSKS